MNEKISAPTASAPYQDDFGRNKMYPTLDNDSSDFRLKKVMDDQKVLETEIRFRKSVYRQYCRVYNFTNMVEYMFVVVDIFLGVTSSLEGTESAFFKSRVSMITFAVVGMISGIIKIAQRTLDQKKLKHYRIMITASTTLSNLDTKISKAINDGLITHEEFEDIQGVMKEWKNFKSAQKTESATVPSQTLELLTIQVRKDMIDKLQKLDQK
jgi:hypothetical protein